MTFASVMGGLAAPLAKRAAVALGIGFISFAGLTAALNTLLDLVRSSWGGLGGDIAALMALGGYNTALAIIGGALIGRVALLAGRRLGVLTGT